MESLTKIFEDEIPIAGLMGAKGVEWTYQRVLLRAPFQKNKNHKNSVFGGSVHALMTLACWAWVNVLLKQEKLKASVVIQASQAKYERPMLKEFFAECLPPKREEVEKFLRILRKKGKARIQLTSRVLVDGQSCAHFSGDFVALMED